MERLGHRLEAAGVDLRIWDANKNYWRGNFVDYQYDTCDILQSDIRGELQAIFQYYQHIQAIPDVKVQNMLRQIIRDEQEHIILLSEKLVKYCPNFNYNDWMGKIVRTLPADAEIKAELIGKLSL